jgi:hypothetical protein
MYVKTSSWKMGMRRIVQENNELTFNIVRRSTDGVQARSGQSQQTREHSVILDESGLVEMQSLVLHTLTEGVSVVSEAGRIIYTNSAEECMLGYEKGELIGQHVSVESAYPP